MKIKPCPFCGSGDVSYVEVKNDYCTLTYCIECRGCLARSRDCLFLDLAVSCWNNRTRYRK